MMNDETIGTMNAKVGILLCSSFRDFLNRLKFKGYDISFIEGSGWITRIFTIKGSRKDLLMIKQTFEKSL